MTSRPNEPYSLINLDDIKTQDGLAAGTESSVFLPFITKFIKDETVNLYSSSLAQSNVPSEMYKNPNAIGFFDSLHDFKSDFIDCQTNIKGDDNNVSFKKFGFSFLLNGGYPELKNIPNLIIQDKYSYLNRVTRPLNQDNLENYFAIGNIYDVIKNNGKGNMYILPNTRKLTASLMNSTNNKIEIYDSIVKLYANYKDQNFGNKIKLIFDFQLNLFDIIKAGTQQNKKEFCLLYTAETITDPAPKMKFDGIVEKFGAENFYFEKLGKERRIQNSNENINGNVNTIFQNLKPSLGTIDGNTDFTVEASYSYGAIQELFETIKMNSKTNTIDTIKNIIRRTIESVSSTADKMPSAIFKESETKRVQFYTDFNKTINNGSQDDYKKKYSIYYARKRLGDTLQGRICKKDKLKTLNFNKIIMQQGNKTGTITDNVIANKDNIKDAVLVTHDRMLFSYAVINEIPVILDLKDNMITYVPPQTQSVSGGKKIKNKEKIDYPLYRSVQKGGDKVEEADTNEVSSIMHNVDSLIRFLYLFSDGRTNLTNYFKNFIKDVSNMLNSNTSNPPFAYLGEYDVNTLIIDKNLNSVTEKINNINEEANAIVRESRPNVYPKDYEGIKKNPRILSIYDKNGNYITVDKFWSTINERYYLQVYFKYGSSKENTFNFYAGEPAKGIGDKDLIKHILTKSSGNEEELSETIISNITNPAIIEELGIFKNTVNKLGTIGVKAGIGATAGIGAGAGVIGLLVFLLYLWITQGSNNSLSGGGSNTNGNNSIYDKVLNVDFNKLKDTTNLIESNIPVLYFLFDLLRQYEVSFINYQEGIDTYYTKINESAILSDMIGVANLMPHNMELYIFLKMLLEDYNESNLNSINYALFEYYMYIYSISKKNVLYSRFQNLKSYLNISYSIDVDPVNLKDIIMQINSNPVNLKSWKYFVQIMEKTTTTNSQVISENYTAEQEGNYNIIYDNVKKYNLSFAGFTEMRSDFITSTVQIVSSMMSKGLMKKYIDMLNLREQKQLPNNNAAGIIQQPYKLITPQMQTSQPIAVGVGGKKYKKNTRKMRKNQKNIKQVSKRKNKQNSKIKTKKNKSI